MFTTPTPTTPGGAPLAPTQTPHRFKPGPRACSAQAARPVGPGTPVFFFGSARISRGPAAGTCETRSAPAGGGRRPGHPKAPPSAGGRRHTGRGTGVGRGQGRAAGRRAPPVAGGLPDRPNYSRGMGR